MTDRNDAEALWQDVQKAFRGTDNRQLWLAWKRAYRSRFWTHFGVMGPGQICAKNGVAYDELLKRITSYEMSQGRSSQVDEHELAAQGTPPSRRME